MIRYLILILIISIPGISIGQKKYSKQSGNTADSNLITIKNWGVSFTKSENWIVSENTDSVITLMQVSGQWKGDIITISYSSGDSITDTDAKFGWVTYYYDNSKHSWMKKYDNEINPEEIEIEKAEVVNKTLDGFPVFDGTSRWKTTIIPLTNKSFLKFNILGGGETQPLMAITGTLRKI